MGEPAEKLTEQGSGEQIEAPGGIELPDGYQPNKEIGFIYEKIIPVFAALSHYLQEFDSTEERIQFVASQIKPYGKYFVGFIDSMRKSDEPIEVEGAIRLYGATNSYDLMMAVALREALGLKFDWDEDTSKPKELPENIIRFAARSRSSFGEESRHSHMAFVCGLALDVLAALNEEHGVSKKKTLEMIEADFEYGIKLANIGLAEGKKLEGLKLEKYLIPTVVLKCAGRVLLSTLNADYESTLKAVFKESFPSPFLHMVESKKFGVSNNILSCIFSKFVPGMSESSAALLFYDYPGIILDTNRREVYDLVTLCVSLAAKAKASGDDS